MINIIVAFLIVSGLIFTTGGAIGILRFPDFYSRLHPAGKLDTGGFFLIMAGLALYTAQEITVGNVLTAVKILLIVVFVFITSPTATHAIVDAGVRGGLSHWTKS